MKRTFKSASVIALAAALGAAQMALSQPTEERDAAELALAFKKLTVVGSALYVAAHPDDENTAFLAYLSRERLVRTAYLSMTRGDGGQNLIGSEKGELMGVIRTQELLAARKIDGAHQFFTRAIDFGYSKTPEETLRIWGKEPVLSDVVWVIRRFRPDIVVTRFPTTGEGGHGHHTASALLAEEAFEAAGDPSRFPEQLAVVKPWRPKRLLWNIFRFGADAPRTAAPGLISADLGAYNVLLGRSYTEIAAQSRSMHKSQGFGSAERRGTFLNDFKPRLGEAASTDLFDGIDLSFNRIPGGKASGLLLAEAQRSFDPKNPAASVPMLLRAYAELQKLSGPEVEAKKDELRDVVRACAGLWLEAIAADPAATPGSALQVKTVALNRSPLPLTLERVEVTAQTGPDSVSAQLKPNEPVKSEVTIRIPGDLDVTNPYWLKKPAGKGLYSVDDRELIGLPEAPVPLVARFTIDFSGQRMTFETPVLFRLTDPVKGEQYRPFEIAPKATVTFDEKVYTFPDTRAHRVRVTVKSGEPSVAGTVRLKLPAGWSAAPASIPFDLKERGAETTALFEVTPSASFGIGTLEALADVGGVVLSRSLQRIEYAHIPVQTLFPPAQARLVRLEVKSDPRTIGYVMGSGDEVPGVLRQLGVAVTLLSDEDLETVDLARFPAIVTGVRAYNTRPRLKQLQARLLNYVQQGGTLVVQYNTSNELATDALGPYPFKISRDRVTVEEAPVTFLKPGHPLLEKPNKITTADFEGWVQERGLYFAEPWDPKYEPILSSHDPNEPEKQGGLLYARAGKGVFIYTGYAFFRQLPAGVPGAIRLFSNLISAN